MSEKKPCPVCNGTGKVGVDEFTVRQCICAFARSMKEHLGQEIALAPSIREGALYMAGGETPKLDRTGENLFIKGYWTDLLPHLKSALVGKGLLFSFTIVTDERLKIVYLGEESYRARSKTKRDEIHTNNSLADLIGPDFQLVLIRLGFLGYKNQAMPGILREALMLREASAKPTWVIEDPDRGYFGPGHLSYNEDVAQDIERRFAILDLTDKDRTPSVSETILVEDVSAEAPAPTRVYVERSRFEARDDGEGALGGGTKSKKSPWKKQRGGGPLG